MGKKTPKQGKPKGPPQERAVKVYDFSKPKQKKK